MKQSFANMLLMVFIFIVSSSLTACLGTREWEYPPQPSGTLLDFKSKGSVPATVVVHPLKDERGNIMQNEYWKAAVPLMPYAETIYDRPDTVENPEPVDALSFDPSRDFAWAIVEELRGADIFSSVTFAEGDTPPTSDLSLQGSLRSTRWRRVITTYLLGPVGPIFWILGLPMGQTTTAVEMDLNLTPANDPSQIIWRFSMEFEGKQLDGPYYGLEDAVRSYPSALQDTLRPAIANLVQLADERPDRLRPGQ